MTETLVARIQRRAAELTGDPYEPVELWYRPWDGGWWEDIVAVLPRRRRGRLLRVKGRTAEEALTRLEQRLGSETRDPLQERRQ